ncbi:hypothetical protein KC19_VG122400 [Ceratodon purpureus]|uniref:Uncharacterized protein n=1 Tax=Ceratodon purpureus TaxID=3225 RepID=A0A8T0HPN2_CERPU|nr:hypothetical protein KC19_VG122400 [Ceratodon purpureus]
MSGSTLFSSPSPPSSVEHEQVASSSSPGFRYTCCRRISVTTEGNCFRSHHPNNLAACLYHKYLLRSGIPNFPLRIHAAGRGCASKYSLSHNLIACIALPSDTPCCKNQQCSLFLHARTASTISNLPLLQHPADKNCSVFTSGDSCNPTLFPTAVVACPAISKRSWSSISPPFFSQCSKLRT